MIGDWVYCCANKPAQVVGLTTDSIETTDKEGYFNEDYFEPIPLTPKILEKNGFVYPSLPFEYYWEGYGLHIYGGNYADGNSVWSINCGINVCMNVTHIHQLQHALRMCGIEKEIKL